MKLIINWRVAEKRYLGWRGRNITHQNEKSGKKKNNLTSELKTSKIVDSFKVLLNWDTLVNTDSSTQSFNFFEH